MSDLGWASWVTTVMDCENWCLHVFSVSLNCMEVTIFFSCFENSVTPIWSHFERYCDSRFQEILNSSKYSLYRFSVIGEEQFSITLQSWWQTRVWPSRVTPKRPNRWHVSTAADISRRLEMISHVIHAIKHGGGAKWEWVALC